MRMKLCDRLNLRPNLYDYTSKLESVEIAKSERPSATDFERACKKFDLPRSRTFLALAYYYSDHHEGARKEAEKSIPDIDEFLFGDWRNVFLTAEKSVDPAWWKRHFMWMQIFEIAVLWAVVLDEWQFVTRVGDFPEPDSYISDGYDRRDRDLYVAWAAFLRHAPGEVQRLLEPLEKSKERSFKLRAILIRSAAERNADALQKALEDWLSFYRKWEFPKEHITKKVSIEGTFFVHWAEKEGIALKVPPEYEDHIVRLPCMR